MTAASRQRNAANHKTQGHVISALFGAAATYKTLWANTRCDDAKSARHMAIAMTAEEGIIGTRAADTNDVLMKLALLMDWLQNDASASARALLQSAIADLETFATPSAPPAQLEPIEAVRARIEAIAPYPARAKPAATPDTDEPKIVIDRRARPCTVNGKLYPSVTAAARALKMSYASVRQMAA